VADADVRRHEPCEEGDGEGGKVAGGWTTGGSEGSGEVALRGVGLKGARLLLIWVGEFG